MLSSARVLTCTKENIACSWMPCDDAHTLRVAFQSHHWLRHGSDEAILRNLPYLQKDKHGTVTCCVTANTSLIITKTHLKGAAATNNTQLAYILVEFKKLVKAKDYPI